MSQSVAYYNKHAQQFMDETLHVDMSVSYVVVCSMRWKTYTFLMPALL